MACRCYGSVYSPSRSMVPSGQTPSPCLTHSDAQKIQTDLGRIGDESERKSERVCTGVLQAQRHVSLNPRSALTHVHIGSKAKWEDKFVTVSKRSNFD